MKHQVQIETYKAAPAIVGAGYSIITLNDVVALVTIIYVVTQLVYLIWKWRKEIKDENKS